jgi:hypothetical protein
MAVGEIITAARYNLMQAKVNSVMGNGSDDYGYGQPLSSSQVQQVTNIVRASHMQKLKTDINKAAVHQTNISTTVPDISNDDDITDAVYAQYESASNTIFTNHLNFDVNQVTAPESKLSSRRTTVWGGGGDPQTVRHEFKATFNSADHYRHFFNSGGEVRLRATLTGGSGAKQTEWISMVNALGIVKLNYNTTTASSGTSFSKGAYDLTSSYQTLWTKAGSGVYSENLITVKAKKSNNVLTMLFEFYDGDSLITLQGFDGVDERVNGTMTSYVEQQRATGSFVEVETPIYKTIISLG